MPVKKYDIIVVGAGSGGIGTAGTANVMGLDVLLIDKTDFNIGGDCLNYGCVPSKALLHVAKLFRKGHLAAQFGLKTSGKADLEKVMDYVHQQQNVIRHHENAAYFRSLGIDMELGVARFVNKNTIEVNGNQYSSNKIVLATGSRPRIIPIKGIERVNLFHNESLFYEMKTLPDRLLVIGGGPIGCEMAQAFQRLGTQVTIVELAPRILLHEAPEFSRILKEKLEAEGVRIFTKSKVLEFDSAHTAVMENENGVHSALGFDTVLMAVGRQLNTEALALENAGIKVEKGGFEVNKYLRTTNKNVYAVGDVAGLYKFSHAAEMHVRQLMYNFFSPLKKAYTDKQLSWVTFTDPEIATFGLSEKTLKEKGIAYEKIVQGFDEDDRAVVENYRYGKLMLYVSKKSVFSWKTTILGGSMIAPNAGELIQELILAANTGMDIDQIFNKIYPYPTAARINQRAVVEYKVRQIAPWMKKLLRLLFRV